MSSQLLDKNPEDSKLSLTDFQKTYNDGIPEDFPRASAKFLEEFKTTYPALFKGDDTWSLELHRKKFMDWLPQHVKSLQRA